MVAYVVVKRIHFALEAVWGDSPRMGPWVAVHTFPGQERKAYDGLVALGVVCFFPFTMEKIYTGRRRTMREELRAFFSRYLFARLPEAGVGLINAVRGVLGVVKNSTGALFVPDAVVRALMALTDRTHSGDLIDKKRLARFLGDDSSHWFEGAVGDKVVLRSGMVAKISSLVELDSHSRISVLINLLGCESETVVPVGSVQEFSAAA